MCRERKDMAQDDESDREMVSWWYDDEGNNEKDAKGEHKRAPSS